MNNAVKFVNSLAKFQGTYGRYNSLPVEQRHHMQLDYEHDLKSFSDAAVDFFGNVSTPDDIVDITDVVSIAVKAAFKKGFQDQKQELDDYISDRVDELLKEKNKKKPSPAKPEPNKKNVSDILD